jgi:single-strand DNA-binding protein
MPNVSLNKVLLIGRIGSPAKVFTTKNQKQVASFSLAVNSARRLKTGEWTQRTDWIRCSLFYPNLIEKVARSEVKGKQCYVEGRFQVDEQQGAERKTFYNVIVEKLVMLESGSSRSAAPAEPGADDVEGDPVDGDDDIPF